MNYVEEQAVKYSKDYLRGIVAKLNLFKDRITSKINEFTNDKDKIYFLRVLQNEIQTSESSRLGKSQIRNTLADELARHGLFAIAQELEQLERFYQEEIFDEDAFTSDERIVIHSNINAVILHLSQEGTLTPEVERDMDILKDSLYLGKNKWVKLLVGTTAQLLLEKIIEKSVVEVIISGVTKGVEYLLGSIGKLLIEF